MKETTIEYLNNLNKNFYESIAEDFSNTRQNYWNGWNKLSKILLKEWTDKSKVSICDLGCGNSRFYSFLLEKFPKLNIKYYGYDFSEKLLKISKEKFPENKYLSKDIINEIDSLHEKFDLVVGFGITHHIPGSSNRLSWHKKCSELLDTNGILVLSYWTGTKKINPPENFDISELEQGDHFSGWSKMENIYRYVHIYTKEELLNIEEQLKNKNTIKADKFNADGRDNQSNLYYLYKKIS